MSSRTSYFNEYYKKRCDDNKEFYEKEKSRIAEYIRNRKLTDPDFVQRLRDDRKRYREKKKLVLALGNNTNLIN